MAYLRLIAQGDDDLAFERIVNKPKRGIGDASVATLHSFARARNCRCWRRRAKSPIPTNCRPRPRRRWPNWPPISRAGRELARVLPHTELAEMVLDESGYTDMLKVDKSAEAPGRLDNLKEFVRSMESLNPWPPSWSMSAW